MNITKNLLVLATFSLGAACAHQDKPTPMTAPPTPPAAALRPAAPGKTSSTIYISEEFRKACAIGVIESTQAAPKFQFDASDITTEDRDVLAQVATCLITGPLKSKSVKLVGRADKRGTTEYNMALGARRADAVKSYLANLGVASSQLTETSRGELDSTGATEEGFRKDRRVDIDIL